MIVLSYRRADSAGLVRALHERLINRLGADKVFLDVDTIAAGADFRAVLRDAIRRADALVVVIGRHWLTTETGARRLDDPDDVVRLEIENALEAKIPIIPVLVDGAGMPAARDLPEPLQALADRNAVEVTNTRFDADAERLLATLAPVPPFPWPAAAALIVGLFAFGVYAIRAAAWSRYAIGLVPIAAIPAIALLPILRRRLPAVGAARHLAAGLCVAAFALLLAGGMAARAQLAATPFAFSVRTVAPSGGARVSGSILLDHGEDRLRSPIGPDGIAHFTRVPGTVRGRDVLVIAEAEGYQPDTMTARAIPGEQIEMTLVAEVIETSVRGRVVDRGGRPLGGVLLDFGDGVARVTSDDDGSFTVAVPWRPGESVMLRATLNAAVGYEQRVTIPASLPLEVPFATTGG